MKNKRIRLVKVLSQTIAILLLLGYLYLLTELLLFSFRTPMGEQSRLTYEEYFKHKVNIVPFKTIQMYLGYNSYNSIINIFGNILVFFPMGLFYGYFFKRTNNVILSILVFSFVSFVFEALQMLFLVGSFDVDDILLNALGGTIGFLLMLLFKGMKYLTQRKHYNSSAKKSAKRQT